MASRKAQREEARARRLAEEKARQERARRTRRLRMIGGVVIAAVALGVVAIAISSGGGHKGGLAKGTAATKTVAQVQSLLQGIPQDGTRLGNPKAPVTMTYYGDLECPVCQAFTLNGFKELVSKDVRSGKVQVVYKALQTATRDQQTFQLQQVAALAAGPAAALLELRRALLPRAGTGRFGLRQRELPRLAGGAGPGLEHEHVAQRPQLVVAGLPDQQRR